MQVGVVPVADSAGNQFYAVSCASSASTTDVQVIDNPTLDFFMGFLIFFLCMVFFIWAFRKN